MTALPRGPGGSGLERASPRGSGLDPGGWVYGFLLAVAGGVAIYVVEGYYVFTGALPPVVRWLTIWGYAIWVLVTASAWYSRGGRKRR